MQATKPTSILPDHWELDRSCLTFGPVLGRGQFGIVRKGTYVSGTVAVKELKKGGF